MPTSAIAGGGCSTSRISRTIRAVVIRAQSLVLPRLVVFAYEPVSVIQLTMIMAGDHRP